MTHDVTSISGVERKITCLDEWVKQNVFVKLFKEFAHYES